MIKHGHRKHTYSTTTMWHSVDNKHDYEKYEKYKNNLYSETDINYSFNKDGFRCDEFDIPSDINILFAGCSITEGIGLPLNEVWTSKLINKIHDATNKNIAYWNVSETGASIDTIAQNIYDHHISYSKKIEYLFLLLPSMYRRRFCFQNFELREWYHPEDKSGAPQCLRDSFSDEFYREYVTLNSLRLIDAVSRINNTKVIVSAWKYLNTGEPIFELDEIKLTKKYFTNWILTPYPNVNLNVDFARDLNHPGRTMHEKIAENYWNIIKQEIKF